jgi:hypothetical protein
LGENNPAKTSPEKFSPVTGIFDYNFPSFSFSLLLVAFRSVDIFYLSCMVSDKIENCVYFFLTVCNYSVIIFKINALLTFKSSKWVVYVIETLRFFLALKTEIHAK